MPCLWEHENAFQRSQDPNINKRCDDRRKRRWKTVVEKPPLRVSQICDYTPAQLRRACHRYEPTYTPARDRVNPLKIHKRLITHTFNAITPTQLRSSRDLRVINHAVVRIVSKTIDSKTHFFPTVIAQKLLHSCSVLETAYRTSLRLLPSLQLSLLRRF